jgi:NAD(P)-dependent dehydrogenase (short-subunit alcohol dehydrogenase family)
MRRVAIVTGAGSGIGRAAAEQLLAGGAYVVGVDIDSASLKWLDGHPRGAAVAGDVGSEECNRAMVETALERFGSLDVLVLNAAVAYVGALDETAPEAIDRILAVNLRGVALGLRAALPALERGSDPAIVTVGSISGMGGEPFMSVYAASKGGVINLTRSAAVELGSRGIRINCVCPGTVITGMTRPTLDASPQKAAALRRNVPLKRLGEPAEIAEVIVFLSSPAASFVHGAIVPVDGGITANVGQQLPPEAPQRLAA